MNYKEFEELLENADLKKTEFSELSEVPYQTVMNWSNSNNVPKWVISWVKNYKEAKDLEKIVQVVKPYIK